ncbi:MAG: hypothetical protein WB555_23115 [Candidatus Korobacteraceae bacterium]
MPQPELNRGGDPDTTDTCWNSLYKVTAVAAVIAALIFRRWLAADFLLFRAIGLIRSGPTRMPTSALDWFTLLHTNRLVGLTFLNVFDSVNYVLVGLIYLGLYAALRRANRSYVTLATALGFVGIAVYLASNQAFSMLLLSDQYAAATTDAQRSMLLAAGQALLAISNPNVLGPGAIGFLLITLAGLIFSIAMLRGSTFAKGTAYTGILANVFGLGYPLGIALAPKTVVIPTVAISLSISALFLLAWYAWIAVRLFQLGYRKPEDSVAKMMERS